MSEFDRFDFENNENKKEEQPRTQDPRLGTQGAAWYMGTAPSAVPPKKGGITKRAKLTLIALIVTVAVIFSAVVGFGIYRIADFIKNHYELDLGGDDGVIPNGTEGGLGNGQVHGIGDAAGYNYAAVTLPKNDGSTLVGSSNGSAGSNAMTRIAAVAAVRDSVVEISTTTVSNRGQLTAGAGSGVIIHADGIVVTNNHVIAGVSNIYVRLTNGNTYEAYLRGTDEENDIAILKISPKETLTVAKLGCSSALALGEDIFAIGNPLGELGGTVTEGIINALEREVEMEDGTIMTLLQTSAAINSGNSGGGLFNMAGELIGVVNAKYSAAGVEGLGFAIPVDSAVISMNHLLDYGYIPGVPSLGATVVDGTFQVGGGFFGSYKTMPYVYAVQNGSPLQVNDIILKVDGNEVSSTSVLKRFVRSKKVGDTVTLTIYRSNQQQTVTVTLVEYIPQ
ncbi:MAG: trypsin-like peptidase domain-containing protein [Clostridia bacterium]|nr:trypsin-like peptidase domain-containing protein [Clostridia bacterium]